VRFLADESPDEGRADSVEQPGPRPLGLVKGQCEQTQVVLLNDVDHCWLRVRQATQQSHGPLVVGAQCGQIDAGHVGRENLSCGLLFHPLAQVRRSISEGGVLGELGLARGRVPIGFRSCVVDGPHGDPPCVPEGWDDNDPVDVVASVGKDLLGENVGLQGEVPTQGGVGPGDEVNVDAHLRGGREGAPGNLTVALRGIFRREAAGVRHDVYRRLALAERPLQRAGRPAHQDREVGDRLGPGGVVIQDDQDAIGAFSQSGDDVRWDLRTLRQAL
jgi:hypothetical protein